MVQQTMRRVLLALWNVYRFFTTFANIDGFKPAYVLEGWRPKADLVRWVLAELNPLIVEVDDILNGNDVGEAGRSTAEFINVLSNGCVRWSRHRLWKSAKGVDKVEAYATL